MLSPPITYPRHGILRRREATHGWFPLVMEGRDPGKVVEAIRMITGTDVDYGAITKMLLGSLRGTPGFSINFLRRVQDLRREGNR